MKNPNELKGKRAANLAETGEMIRKAEAEKRDFTVSEAKQFDKLITEADQLKFRIMQIEADNETEMAAGGRPAAMFGKSGEELFMPRGRKSIYLTDEDRAFLNYIRKGKSGITQDEQRALVEDTTGGYLVSPAIEEELERSLAKLVPIRQLASKRTINKDRVLVRQITEATVSWGKLETGSEIEESTPTPAESYKFVEDQAGLIKIGRDELEDSDSDLANFIVNSFSRATAEKENLGFLKGRGHASSEPDGITVDPTLVSATMATAVADAISIEDMMQMVYQVPSKYRPGSAWVINSTLEFELRKLRPEISDGYFGNFFWVPAVSEGLPPTFMGYPVYNDDEMDDLTDTQGVIAVFGNFAAGYRILDRAEISILRMNELYAEAGLVGFMAYRRVGGYLIKPSNKALVLLTEHSA